MSGAPALAYEKGARLVGSDGTMRNPNPARAGALAGGTSLALLLGALLFQYIGGLSPCEMCIWQRWPHGIAAFLGLGGYLLTRNKQIGAGPAAILASLAILSLIISGAIGVFQAGVEWGWWEGPAHCTGSGYVPGATTGFDVFNVVRCDVAEWRLMGLSLAGYNALISFGIAGLSMVLARSKR